jgi:Rod binding domain-containing protein
MNVSSAIPLSSLSGDAALARELNQPETREQVESAATQFESVFMSMLVKEMRATTENGLFEGEASDTLGGMFDLYLGQHMAEAGGIGVKQMLLNRYREQQGAVADVGTSPSRDEPVTLDVK